MKKSKYLIGAVLMSIALLFVGCNKEVEDTSRYEILQNIKFRQSHEVVKYARIPLNKGSVSLDSAFAWYYDTHIYTTIDTTYTVPNTYSITTKIYDDQYLDSYGNKIPIYSNTRDITDPNKICLTKAWEFVTAEDIVNNLKDFEEENCVNPVLWSGGIFYAEDVY